MQLRWVKPSTDGYKIPHKGEVWLIDHEPTQGHELRSIHYFVIVTDKALNEKLGMALLLPNDSGRWIATMGRDYCSAGQGQYSIR